MAKEDAWKWWISSFAFPLAMLVVSVTTVFVAYLQYAKDINEMRVDFDKALAERDLIIERQTAELESLHKKATRTPAPSHNIDYSRYRYLLTESESKTWAEDVAGFLRNYWKTLCTGCYLVCCGHRYPLERTIRTVAAMSGCLHLVLTACVKKSVSALDGDRRCTSHALVSSLGYTPRPC